MLSPPPLAIPSRRKWGTHWQARGECENGTMDAFVRQGQCRINGHQIMIKDYPTLSQDLKMRNEDSVGSPLHLPTPIPRQG